MLQSAVIVRPLRPLASLRLTSAALAVLALCVVASHTGAGLPRLWMALPLTLLALNLVAALVCNLRLRRSGGLVVFHAALLAVCLLWAANLLSEFEAHVELAEGQTYDGADLHVVRSGPWSGGGPRALNLEQGAIDVDFLRGLVRQQARSRLLLSAGQARVLSDTEPLQIGGYRFAPSANKGFAVVLAWRDGRGDVSMGSLNMPSYPALEWKQEQHWRTPAGEVVRVTLALPPRAPDAWSLRALLPAAVVSLHAAGGERVLPPGEAVPMRGGTLTLVAVRLWMGYRVTRQPVLPALLAVALVGVAALGWHVLRQHFPGARSLPAAPDDVAGVARALRV